MTLAPTEPRISLVVPDRDDQPLSGGVLKSLSRHRQVDIPDGTYEVVIVAREERQAALGSVVELLGVPVRFTTAASLPWWSTGAEAARGTFVALLGSPGLATPTLVSSLCAALDSHPDEPIVIRTFALTADRGITTDDWLEASGWPKDGHSLVRRATFSWFEEPPFQWLDVVDRADNAVWPRHRLISMGSAPATDRAKDPTDVVGRARQQLIGDGLVRVRAFADPVEPGGRPEPERRGALGTRVDPQVRFFGTVVMQGQERTARPPSYARAQSPRLSVIIVTHDMQREAPRTLRSLLPSYQRDLAEDAYEIILVDNDSKAPLTEAEVHSVAPDVSYHQLRGAPPSPAHAINYGAARASGEALAIVVDGACLLSPGLLAAGLLAFRPFPLPIVVTRYFFLGPGDQVETIFEGYDKQVEDALLNGIDWPSDGYELFDVSSPLAFEGNPVSWMSGWFESNCLFMPKVVFDRIGGCDERFDLPGGGLLIADLLARACAGNDTHLVQLLGEGVFHQVHGGVTTNTSRADLLEKKRAYIDQYSALRGGQPSLGTKTWNFLGRLTTPACRKKMRG